MCLLRQEYSAILKKSATHGGGGQSKETQQILRLTNIQDSAAREAERDMRGRPRTVSFSGGEKGKGKERAVEAS